MAWIKRLNTWRHSGINIPTAIVLFLLLAPALHAQTSTPPPSAPPMVDPLLGLSFDPAKARFQVWQDSSATRTEMGNEPKWVFGCTPMVKGKEKASICIVAGHHALASDGAGASLLEPDFGAVVHRQGEEDKILGVPDRLFAEPPLLAPDTLDLLLQDAVSRYLRAFGGAAALQSQLIVQGVNTDTVPSALLNALKRRAVAVRRAENAN